jgi:hypothetical protein
MKRGIALLALGGAVAGATVAVAFAGALGPPDAAASSHREAPLISDDPAADNTDVYAFVSPDAPDTVTIIANYIPFEDSSARPSLAQRRVTGTQSRTSCSSGSDLCLEPHVPLQQGGSSPTDGRSVKQTYSVTRVTSSGSTVLGFEPAGPPANIGPRSNPTYDPFAGVVISLQRKVFAGAS